MPTDDQASASKTQDKSEKSGELSSLRRITLVTVVLALVIFTYYVIADRTTPFTGDAQVQAFVLKVATELNGRIEVVGVTDNQIVEQNDELLRMDRTPFEIAVRQPRHACNRPVKESAPPRHRWSSPKPGSTKPAPMLPMSGPSPAACSIW